MTLFKFGDFYLNTFDRTLFKNNSSIPIPSKTFDVLIQLIKYSGKTITKNKIMNEVWDGSFVEEGNLSVHISKLRKLLEATTDEPFIKTVSGQGYQFVVNVEAVDELAKKNNGRSNPVNEDVFRPDSIAVLPLKNENGDEEIDYLADGITESLINSLSYLPDFRVLARDTVFRFKNQDVDPMEIGRLLGVATVLTGRIRILKENLVIGVELVKVEDGTQIWGTQINQPFSDIFEMQESLTLEISAHLESKTTELMLNSFPMRLAKDPESYELYLKGKYLLEKHSPDNINHAIKFFEQSISRDQDNTLAHIALAESYYWLYVWHCNAFESCRDLILGHLSIASELGSETPEFHTMMGMASLDLEWDIQEAERCFKIAININPNYISARHAYSQLLVVCGRPEEAMVQIQAFSNLAPASPITNRYEAQRYYCMGFLKLASIKLREALELEPSDPGLYTILGAVLAELGEFKEAINSLQHSDSILAHVVNKSLLGYVHARAGDKDRAIKMLELLETESSYVLVPETYSGIIYAALNDKEPAFDCLNRALDSHDANLICLKMDPRWSNLRSDDRFTELVKRVGLPIG